MSRYAGAILLAKLLIWRRWQLTMEMGPNTVEEVGAIVSALRTGRVEVVVAGRWAITAYDAANPSFEIQEWLTKNPPDRVIDLACSEHDRTASVLLLETLGFQLRKESDRELQFEDSLNNLLILHLFRRARDGGRVYRNLGLADEDLYFPPESVTNGRLGFVDVRTEGPNGHARPAQASDLE